MADGHTFDAPLADHMLMVTNYDRPGVIGTVGTLLGDAGVNIADMDVGRSDEGIVVMLIAITSPIEAAVLDDLRPPPASSTSPPSPATRRHTWFVACGW